MEYDISKKTIKEIESDFNTDLITGLSKKEVIDRLSKYGSNSIRKNKRRSLLEMFIAQIADFMVLTLIGAAILATVIGESREAVLIIIIVIINAFLGILQENKAEKSLEAIKKLAAPQAKVIREAELEIIPASELVIGDIVLLEAGDYVPADVRLFAINNLRIDESPLTGESVPVEKNDDTINRDNIALGDIHNCAFMGTAVTYGNGKGIVVATGMNAEIGKIAKLITEAEYLQTPIQKSLDKLGKMILISILLFCTIIFFIGLDQEFSFFTMFITVVSLAVAAIPEGLPAIVTIVLALGMQRMVKRNAIIRKLPAVETLGSTDIICSDKTGTLTMNKMTVEELFIDNKHVSINQEKTNEMINRLILYSILCNNTKVDKEDGRYVKIGDPTEVALIDMAINCNIDPLQKIKQYKRISEIPFSSERKLMTTVNMINNKKIVISKGAPEVILNLCQNIYLQNTVFPLTKTHQEIINRANDKMTNSALRVIAVAYKVVDEISDSVEKNLTFVGLIGMIDPPRKEVKSAIKKCATAGIETIMITGDHKNTAVAIAKSLALIDNDNEAITGTELDKLTDKELNKNIDNYKVYARVSPEHKLRIVKAWQRLGKVVAMTGDGVNDAPALKQADIGIAMGISGTEVAKEASDMILTDDNFTTIVYAVEEGRTIFANIKKAIRFLLSCNLGEIITILLGIILGKFLYSVSVSPLSAVQLLWGNLVTDSLIAISLGLEKPEPDVMKKRKESSSIIDFNAGSIIFFQGLLIGLLSFMAFHIGIKETSSVTVGQTMAFMTLTITQLFHAFNMRSEQSIFKIGLFSNKYMINAFLFSLFLQLSTLMFSFTRKIFNTVLLSPEQLLIVFVLSIIPVIVMEFSKLFYQQLYVPEKSQ